MGGRGASSGGSYTFRKKDYGYGDEYETVLEWKNVKFVQVKDEFNPTPPMETRTKGRIYVTLASDGEPKWITFYDSAGKRNKQIDLRGQSHKVDGKPTLPHVHVGYDVHPKDGVRKTTPAEDRFIDIIMKLWEDWKRGQ